MKVSKTSSRQARRIHRWLVPIAAAPLLFTGMVFDVGLDGSTGKLQSELTLTARRKQSVHIQPRQPIQKYQG